MPKIETIKAVDAPEPPQKMSESTQQLLDAVATLSKDEVLRIQPDPGKTMRGVKMAVSRLASRNKLKLESWEADNDGNLYVRKR